MAKDQKEREMVAVMCMLGSGLHLRLFDIKEMDPGTRSAIPRPETVTLVNGENNVPKDFMDAWLEQNDTHDAVLNGFIFVRDPEPSAADLQKQTDETNRKAGVSAGALHGQSHAGHPQPSAPQASAQSSGKTAEEQRGAGGDGASPGSAGSAAATSNAATPGEKLAKPNAETANRQSSEKSVGGAAGKK